ncbi:MAG: hypothetical protein CMJ23_06935 [Phycisphaerae bacterium]|nr:hypothetical protein [Phycisphaerae bacterium]
MICFPRDDVRRREGGLLLETLLSLALLVMIGLFALSIARDSVEATERAARRVAAVELAASRIAEIEAGLISLDAIGDLADGPEADFESEFDASVEPRWSFVVSVETSPAEIEGLARIEVTVRDETEQGEGQVLASLVALVADAGSGPS